MNNSENRFSPFQWAIDVTQKFPKWWCRQCLAASFIACLMAEFLRDGPFDGIRLASLVYGALVYAVGCFWVSSDAHIATLGANKYLQIFSWLIVAGMTARFFSNASAVGAANLTSQVTFAALFSFAACRPPAPPRRRQKLALGSTS